MACRTGLLSRQITDRRQHRELGAASHTHWQGGLALAGGPYRRSALGSVVCPRVAQECSGSLAGTAPPVCSLDRQFVSSEVASAHTHWL